MSQFSLLIQEFLYVLWDINAGPNSGDGLSSIE